MRGREETISPSRGELDGVGTTLPRLGTPSGSPPVGAGEAHAVDSLFPWAWRWLLQITSDIVEKWDLDPSDAEDLAAKLMVDLWREILPGLDPENESVDAYIKTSIRNRLFNHTRSLLRNRFKHRAITAIDAVARPDGFLDRQAYELADAICNHPGRFLDARDLRVVRALLDQPAGTTDKQIAESIGMKPVAFCRALARARGNIMKLWDAKGF